VFGDKLNTTNLSGCGVVFLGVLLYKIVFHMEKLEAKKHRRKDSYDNVLASLVVNVDTLGGGDDVAGSEVEEECIPARSIELRDRRGVEASPRASPRKSDFPIESTPKFDVQDSATLDDDDTP
jgi:hypothetical protein